MRLFLLLQVLDVMTTLLGFRLGASEASPAIRLMIGVSNPVLGLLIAKLVAMMLVAVLRCTGRSLRKVNVWFSVLVMWNVFQIARLL